MEGLGCYVLGGSACHILQLQSMLDNHIACENTNVKVKVKLHFSAPSAGIAEIEQT